MDVKVVVVGNGGVGKSSLITTFGCGAFPEPEYAYYSFDELVAMTVDNTPVRIRPWDTNSQEDYDRLRPLSYPSTDVFLVCFSVDSPESYADIQTQWYPEITRYCPDTPIILVGTKLDLREDVEMVEDLKQRRGCDMVSILDGLRLMSGNPNVVRYMECSSITQTGLREIFSEAARITIQQQRTTTRQSNNCCTLM